MNNDTGIKQTNELIKERLKDYIKSQYFGDNQLLLNASEKLLGNEGNLYQKPYIESTPSYKKQKDGIRTSNMDDSVKKLFLELIENNLGVFEVPFEHQVKALEDFVNGKNLFVATGTGSGKTECFMWPIIYKLCYEAIHRPDNWKQRGVRTILIYPMNALVSDQISRLRSIIGDDEGKFVEIFSRYCDNSRRPQFGMYTGRTPYPGKAINKKTNIEIARSYKDSYLVDEEADPETRMYKEKDIEGLKEIHKYPAKDIGEFVRSLATNTLEKYDSSKDAELMLRYEIQNHTPDILITNYSMLEYMLIRKEENNIWKDTSTWGIFSTSNRSWLTRALLHTRRRALRLMDMYATLQTRTLSRPSWRKFTKR